MQIKELFERDPKRKIEPIVKVTLHDLKIVRIELEEYVVTDQIKYYFNELTDEFVQSRQGTHSSVCTWISGFFGSGKSHFLKLLGYVLENKIIEMDNGAVSGAAEYFFDKHSLTKVNAKILEKELRTKALFINMLDFDREKGPDITRIIYSALLRELNLSEIFWISEFERMMLDKGVYADFLSFVELKEGKSWIEIRKNVINARSIITQGLTKILPEDYPSLKIANDSIDDVKEEFTMNPRKLADRLVEEAEKIDKSKGRLAILLDEVGLYIGMDTDRLTDLNAISERISEICNGKVWLYVTAQEALEEVIPKVESKLGQFEWIKDRFRPIKLTPENIDTVVKKRLLQKTSQKTNLGELENLYDNNSGSLALNITFKDPAHDPQGLFTKLDKNQFITSYPLTPYYVRLIQDILGVLRSKGGEGVEITGRERAVLAVTRSVLISQFNENILIDSDLGKLATLDMVYDAINEELKAVRSAQQAVIEKDIRGSENGLKVNSVAKALFLLQQVGNWIPCTIENIAAVLYSDVGLEQDQHLKAVKNCLKKLQEEKWIAVDDNEYKFLTEVERTFEHTVAAQKVTEHEKRELSTEILKDALKSFKNYNYNGKPFNVHFSADDHDVTSKGHLNLQFYSPYYVINNQIEATKLSESIANRNSVYWLSNPDKRFDEALEKVISIKKGLEEKNKTSLSEEERKILEKPRSEMENLKEDELPRLFKNATTKGKILVKGEEISLDGKKKIQEIFNIYMKELVENLFTEYSHAAFRLQKDEDIGKILDWQGGTLPSIYKKLELIDDQGILTNRTVAARILSEIRRREEEGIEKNGASLENYFDSPPYGWDARIIRLVTATLFKNDSISVNLDGKDFFSASDQSSKDVFNNSRSFRRAIFSLGQDVSPDDREKARKLIGQIFSEHTGNTIDDVDQSLTTIVNYHLKDCERIKNTTKSLPTNPALSSLCEALKKIDKAPTKSRRIFTFLDDEINLTISQNLEVLEKMREFEGLINTYQTYMDLSDVAVQLSGISENSEYEIKSLKSDLLAEDFFDRWSEITTKAKSLMDKYTSKYSDLHQERYEKVSSALEYLQKHEAMKKLDENEKINIVLEITKLECDNEDFSRITKKPFRCNKCETELSTLNVELETIENRKRKIKRKLDTNLRPKKPELLKGFKEVKEVKSMDDIQEIIDRMQDVVEKAEKVGKKVRANVELEVR